MEGEGGQMDAWMKREGRIKSKGWMDVVAWMLLDALNRKDYVARRRRLQTQ